MSLQDPSLELMVPHLVDILLESSAANTAYKYRVAEMEDLGAV